jgi:hypothetical protein
VWGLIQNALGENVMTSGVRLLGLFDIFFGMAEVAIAMPLFTAENARDNALKSSEVRRQRRERLRHRIPSVH